MIEKIVAHARIVTHSMVKAPRLRHVLETLNNGIMQENVHFGVETRRCIGSRKNILSSSTSQVDIGQTKHSTLVNRSVSCIDRCIKLVLVCSLKWLKNRNPCLTSSSGSQVTEK